jgi:quercetin dioxygenase-like cupin family protein
MSTSEAEARKPVVLAPGQDGWYPMGRISAVFKADGPETESRYSVSEWWLEPRTQGPGAHAHPEDDLFYVIKGTMSVLVGDEWFEAAKGSFVLVPGGVTHDRRGSDSAGDRRAQFYSRKCGLTFVAGKRGIARSSTCFVRRGLLSC